MQKFTKIITCSLSLLLLMLSTVVCNAQYQDRYWIFGAGNGSNVNWDFYPNGPSGLYNTPTPPSLAAQPNNVTHSNGFESWTVVTEPETGNLLFYTDGNKVYDANHADISPVGGLGASPSCTQPVAVCALPVFPFNQYYIFSNPTGIVGSSKPAGPVSFRIYDTAIGSFSSSYSLPGPYANTAVGEGMIIIPNRTNSFEYWLLTRLRDQQPGASSNTYVVYKIDANGVQYSGDANFGPLVPSTLANPVSPIVNMAYRNIPNKPEDVLVGFTVSRPTSTTNNEVFTRIFDSATGTFTGNANTIVSFPNDIMYDLEFSPSGEYLYYATYFNSVLYRAKINPTTGGLNGVARDIIHDTGHVRGGGLKLAPDGYIYHISNAGFVEFFLGTTNFSTVQIGRVAQPDLATASYTSQVVSIQHAFAYNFPEFVNIPSQEAAARVKVKVVTHPDLGMLDLNFQLIESEQVHVEIFSLEGKRLINTTQDLSPGEAQINLDLNELPNGYFIYRLTTTAWSDQGKLYLHK